jgi:hypothetical protein
MVFIEDLETNEVHVHETGTSTSAPPSSSAASPSSSAAPPASTAAPPPPFALRPDPYAVSRIMDMAHYCNLDFGVLMQVFPSYWGFPTPSEPWGLNFWAGMEAALCNHYWQRAKARLWLRDIWSYWGFFEPPLEFSKRIAQLARSSTNPGGGLRYPARIYNSAGEIWVVCFNILINVTTPWRIHSSWVWVSSDAEEDEIEHPNLFMR